MLKHHNLYGQSYVHEFQFMNPDSIKHAVRRYNMERAAERDEIRKQRDAHRPCKPRFHKIRNTGSDVLGMVRSRDQDVETQMSKQLSDDNSDSQIEQSYYDQQQHHQKRLAGGANTQQIAKKKVKGQRPKRSPIKPKQTDTVTYEACIEGLHREVCAELKQMQQSQPQDPAKIKRKSKQQTGNQKHQSIPSPDKQKKQPSRSTTNQSSPDLVMQRIKQALAVSHEDYRKPQAQWVDIVPSSMMHQMPPMLLMISEQPGCSGEPATIANDQQQQQQEYAIHPGYMRYTESMLHNPSEPSAGGTVDNSCSIQLHPHQHPQWFSLMRSLRPMNYTSQRSETDNCTLRESPEQEQEMRTSKAVVARQQSSAVGRSGRRAKPALAKQCQTGGRDKVRPLGEISTTLAMIPLPRRRKTHNVICTRSLENLKYQKIAIYSKISMTQERLITALDRLQGSLIQLPSSLPTHRSHHSGQEKQRRERNAFNFCVRFTRNFLYPLRGMIEDVRSTPVASFNSATCNDASQRVVCVYALMLHSIGKYQRHIRYFLLDKVPQKLSALIEMMYTVTTVCLQKGVLDRQDPVVECLQQRCTSFLTLIEDMQEERFLMARETYRHLQRRIQGPNHAAGQHHRYDLKMCLNDLKLYEPRLVPKERTTEKRRRRASLQVRKSKVLAVPNCDQSQPGPIEISQSEMQLEQRNIDKVNTHIECVQCGDYCSEEPEPEPEPEPSENAQQHQLTNIMELLKQSGHGKRELHKQLLEAMEHVTKSQVREVLDPLVRSLGAMLDKKMQRNQY
ncbi:uncharacterized protein LOC6565389 [Drosophila grimshawi]|uniref:GH11913 n=1 Tax=Drosophila grimshawi TaxID=7222 RepID=B4JL82_DROGR|nr:uncharacterized protein LOC6565389 [Drosophila grimshawi]EDW00335.1 GH11913 [Drosophila grimshawi]